MTPKELEDYLNAPSGIGPHAFTWSDKPHRLLYDLLAEIQRLNLIAEIQRYNPVIPFVRCERYNPVHDGWHEQLDSCKHPYPQKEGNH